METKALRPSNQNLTSLHSARSVREGSLQFPLCRLSLMDKPGKVVRFSTNQMPCSQGVTSAPELGFGFSIWKLTKTKPLHIFAAMMREDCLVRLLSMNLWRTSQTKSEPVHCQHMETRWAHILQLIGDGSFWTALPTLKNSMILKIHGHRTSSFRKM